MVAEVNKTLANQKITVELTDDAAAELVKVGYDPRLGARPMRRMVQRRVEDGRRRRPAKSCAAQLVPSPATPSTPSDAKP
jgi:hypothetical protein